MATIAPALTVYQGQKLVLDIVIEVDGAALDITGYTGSAITARVGTRGDEQAITASIGSSDSTLALGSDPSAGQATLTLVAADTEDLSAGETYTLEVWLQDAGGTHEAPVVIAPVRVVDSLHVAG